MFFGSARGLFGPHDTALTPKNTTGTFVSIFAQSVEAFLVRLSHAELLTGRLFCFVLGFVWFVFAFSSLFSRFVPLRRNSGLA